MEVETKVAPQAFAACWSALWEIPVVGQLTRRSEGAQGDDHEHRLAAVEASRILQQTAEGPSCGASKREKADLRDGRCERARETAALGQPPTQQQAADETVDQTHELQKI